MSIDLLMRELRRRGHSVHLYTNSIPGYQDPDPSTFRFRSVETPFAKGYPIAYPPFLRGLRRFRRNEYDLIHTHSPFTIGFVGLRWAQSHEIPIVTTYHTLYDRYAHYLPVSRRYIRFKIAKHTNYYYNRVDHVVTPSEAALKWLRRHSVETPATIIPTAILPKRRLDREEVRAELGLGEDERVLLYVGRIAKEKNLTTLVRSVAEAMRRDGSLRLMLVGDGPYRPTIAALARDLNVADRVRFEGFVPRAEVDRYYAAADLFVFASITETQGLVVEEAMGYGLPAVAAIGGGASEPIEDGVNGFAVPNQPKEMTDAILRVFEDPARMRRLRAGAERSALEYSPESMCQKMLEVYRLVREKGSIHAA